MAKKNIKVFDLHIGVSDTVLLLKKNCFIKGKPVGRFPNQFDLIRAKDGNLNLFLGMMCPIVIKNEQFILPKNSFAEVLRHIKVYKKLDENRALIIVRNKNDLLRKGLKVIIGLEGIYFLRNKEDFFHAETLVKQGIRVIGPMWNLKNRLFYDKKITNLGKRFLNFCSKKKIILDLAHSENNYFWQIIENYYGPVIDSHTGYQKCKSNKRNIKKSQIDAIIKRNGLIGIYFVGEFIGGNKLDNIYAHISSFVEDFGTNNLCLGSDFDGMLNTDLIDNLYDVSSYPKLYEFLLQKGFEDRILKKIFYENAYKFFLKHL